MPKLILEFNLPDEKPEAELAQKAGTYYSILHDIWQYRRQLDKYDDRETVSKEEIIDKLQELLAEFDF